MANGKTIIESIIFSSFESEGPFPKVCLPKKLPEADQFLIAMKSISLLMGEQIYQEGKDFDISYFGILPFPDISLISLTYFFLIRDDTARGKAKASTISLLIHEDKAQFLYNNMKQLSVLVSDIAEKIDKNTTDDELEEIILLLNERINDFTSGLNPSHQSSSRTIKILFTGLDASGKTSFLRAIKKQYSALIGINPTKGFKRTQDRILGKNLVEWDIGGQKKYRTKFIKDASLYLYDTNLIFFLLDVRNRSRYDESLDFFKDVLSRLRDLEQFPPIIMCLHKMDPEIKEIDKYKERIQSLKSVISKLGEGFNIKFFETSIFDNYSLIKSFSEGITSMSPNRDMFQAQLKWFAQRIEAKSILLLNVQSIILGSFSIDEKTGIVAEMAAPHFQNLYRTFEEFNLLKTNKAIWKMEENFVIFYKFMVGEHPLYILCLTNKGEENLLMDELIPDLQEKISPLIHTYL